jgi:hypothetical protein
MGEKPETTSAFRICCLTEAEISLEELLADSTQYLANMVDIVNWISFEQRMGELRGLCSWFVTVK